MPLGDGQLHRVDGRHDQRGGTAVHRHRRTPETEQVKHVQLGQLHGQLAAAAGAESVLKLLRAPAAHGETKHRVLRLAGEQVAAAEDGAETGTAEKAGVGGAELHRQVLALAAGDGCGKRSRDAAAHQQREGDLQGGCQQTCQQ